MLGSLYCLRQTKNYSKLRLYIVNKIIYAVNKKDIPLNEQIACKRQKPDSIIV